MSLVSAGGVIKLFLCVSPHSQQFLELILDIMFSIKLIGRKILINVEAPIKGVII